MTAGLVTAGGGLLLLITFLITCICRRRCCCIEARHRVIYAQQRNEDKGNEKLVVDCAGLEMALIAAGTLTSSSSQPSSFSQPTTSRNANPYQPTTVHWEREIVLLNEQQKKTQSDLNATSKKIKEAEKNLNELKKKINIQTSKQIKTQSAADKKNQLNHPTTNILTKKRNNN